MKVPIIIVFLLTTSACKQAKQIDRLLTKKLIYTAYSWNIGLKSPELHIAFYLEIDKSGNYICMRHNSFIDSPLYFKGVINDTVLNLINSTLIDTSFKKSYFFKQPNSVLYCGYNYCIDYETKNGIKKTIQFIPSQSPIPIKTLATLFDTLIYSADKTQIQPFLIDSFTNKIKNFDFMDRPPVMCEPPKVYFKIPKE